MIYDIRQTNDRNIYLSNWAICSALRPGARLVFLNGQNSNISFFLGQENISNLSFINTNIYICLPEQANTNSLPLKSSPTRSGTNFILIDTFICLYVICLYVLSGSVFNYKRPNAVHAIEDTIKNIWFPVHICWCRSCSSWSPKSGSSCCPVVLKKTHVP